MRSKNAQRKVEHIFDFLYADYGINIKGRKIIICFLSCRHAQSCAFILVIELLRIPAYCPKKYENVFQQIFQQDVSNEYEEALRIFENVVNKK